MLASFSGAPIVRYDVTRPGELASGAPDPASVLGQYQGLSSISIGGTHGATFAYARIGCA
jgi:hypothetical protein